MRSRLYSKCFILTLCLTYSMFAYAAQPDTTCYPTVDAKLPQYIVGYGSLMQTKSKSTAHPNTGENIPVTIQGYQRGWFSQGSPIGFSTTFLGVIKDENARFNAALFELTEKNSVEKYDQRETSYCRMPVSPEQIQMLNKKPVPKGQFWIYVSQPASIAKPSKKYPIVQSYVDVFMSGCFELQEKYGIETFANDCIETTQGWSKHWVNDRPIPRRPWVYEPQATKIDQLLSSKLNDIFTEIRIE